MSSGLARQLSLALAALLLLFGLLVAVLVHEGAQQFESELRQRMSQGLARHIVAQWPQVSSGDASDAEARGELLRMLMVVNPDVQVYVLDAGGHVAAYIGQPGMVRTPQVDLVAVRQFLSGAALPLLGTDPMGGDTRRVFSAAMFAPRPGATLPPGYLYVVLESAARGALAQDTRWWPLWRGAAWAAGAALLLTLLAGALVFRHLTLPLNRLAHRLRGFALGTGLAQAGLPETSVGGHEVAAIGSAFDAMAARVVEQARAREEQASAHRDIIANVAHDLRTPLTALHGQLEALGSRTNADDSADNSADDSADNDARRARLLAAALAQSNKVRRLSQQLFELATLQSTDQVLNRERFRLDELVADAVQKFDQGHAQPAVALAGEPPGPVECEGDLHLIERALTNLIDNAVRHASGAAPVRVSLQCVGPEMTVVVEDSGPGLPPELARRLDAGQPVSDPPLPRPGGGTGGLGLAIAQRIAALHGGSLRTLPAPGGGTRLALALPR